MRFITKYLDGYVLALLGMVALACLLPARGGAVAPVEWATNIAIGLLFFLYGARLSTEETKEGFRHWRLHLLVLAFTFVAFPLLGLVIRPIADTFLPHTLSLGLLYLTLLPSTVQSSVTFTSLARGNVAASICAASFSNMLGVVLTPLLVIGVMGGQAAFSLDSAEKLIVQLLLPFILGQFCHKRLGGFLAEHKQGLTYLDRGGIMLVVYSAFSAGMREHMWSHVTVWQVVALLLICAVLLAVVMVGSYVTARRLGFSRADEVAIVFCGSKKSMASGLPMATVLFPSGVGLLVLPLMMFHQLQLIVCAQVARQWPDEPALGRAPEDGVRE